MNFREWFFSRKEEKEELKPILGNETKFLAFSDGKIFYSQVPFDYHDLIWEKQAIHYAKQKYPSENISENQPWYFAAEKIPMAQGHIYERNEQRHIIIIGPKRLESFLFPILERLLQDKQVGSKTILHVSGYSEMIISKALNKFSEISDEIKAGAPTEKEMRNMTMQQIRRRFKSEREFQEFMAKMRKPSSSRGLMPPSRDAGQIVDRYYQGKDPYGF
jgi:hypothetical protein